MRALFIATLAAAAVAGLAGCTYDAGNSDTSVEAPTPSETTSLPSVGKPQDPSAPKPPDGATPSAPVSISPSGVVVPEGVRQLPAAQVDSSALPVYYEHRGEVFEFDGGRSLQVFAAASSACTDAEAVVIDQTPDGIRIMLRPLPRPAGGRPDGGACAAVVTPRPVVVSLTEPLGDRKVYLGMGR
jgi:hypothetical protein